jgi:hypothetical protein
LDAVKEPDDECDGQIKTILNRASPEPDNCVHDEDDKDSPAQEAADEDE